MSEATSSSTEELTFELDARRVAFELDESLYPKSAVLGAAYLFVDRCFVFLTRSSEGAIRVQLRAKESATEDELVALAGEFGNELLNQVLREQVGESTRRIREYYMGRAFFGDDSRSSIDALLAELDAEELADEPLEIEVPWATSAGGDGAGSAGDNG